MLDYTKFTDEQLTYDLREYTRNAAFYAARPDGREIAEKIRLIMLEIHKRRHGEPLSR